MNTEQFFTTGIRNANGPATLFSAAILLFMLLFGASQSFARNSGGGYHNGASGGFTGPGPGLVTVEQAKSMRDDSHVALRGYIVQSLDGEQYLFKDDTGTVTVEIEREYWAGQAVGPEDLVEIYGEVDKEWLTVEIEVKRLVKL